MDRRQKLERDCKPSPGPLLGRVAAFSAHTANHVPRVSKHAVAPPTEFTIGDKMRLALGALILLLGFALLWRTLPLGLTPQALVVSAAFIGFGVYRLWLGYTRLREWKARK